jgi:UDP-N-acetylmuramyl pentapeptide synthase
MLELGPGSARIHAEVARDVAACDFDIIVATGEFVAAFDAHRAASAAVSSRQQTRWLRSQLLAERMTGRELLLLKVRAAWRWSACCRVTGKMGVAPPARGGLRAAGDRIEHRVA